MENLNIIYGKNATLELLKNKKRSVNKIIISKGLNKDTKIDEIILLAKENNIMFQFVPKEKFTQYKEFNHQGVIAYVAPISYTDFYDFLEKPAKNQHKKVIILDGVEDPHNLGAIMRTACSAGCHGIIMPKRRSCPVNGTVAKVAAGAAEHLPVARVSNLATAVEALKKEGLWIVGTDMHGDRNHFEADLTGPLGIVMGSEGEGMSRLMTEKCDFLVKIPMPGPTESLNVSVATGVITFEALRQRMK